MRRSAASGVVGEFASELDQWPYDAGDDPSFFCWNYYRAPLRILTDENASLRAQLLEYQSTSSKETLNINGIEIKGRWFGDRFILDNEVCVLANYSVREDPIPAFLSSPANALVSLRYKIEGFLIVRLGGNKDTGQIVEQATGVIEIPTDEKRSVYYSNVQGNGDLNLWVLGWIEGGKK